jgi:cyclic pyranopterin phosphate synthase
MTAVSPLTDRFGRRIEYLRISLTERCDLRCVYCQPAGCARVPSPDVLTAEHVLTVARAGLGLGITRVRLTGGEPLMRGDLEQIVAGVSALPGLADLSLTTNGQRLAARAQALAAAGLRRVNVSLDSFDPEAYRAVTGGELAPVLAGVEAALAAGLSPVKLNAVLSGPRMLDHQVGAFVEFIRRRPVHVRFIEAMPTGSCRGYLPASRILERLAQEGDLVAIAGPPGGGPASYYRLGNSLGTIGVIAAISEPFCGRCNRLRVSASGKLLSCLFSTATLDIMPALGASDPVGAVSEVMVAAAAAKPRAYADVASDTGISAMHAIGG